MRPLRILHVTPYFADAWAYGGIPRLVGTLARGLARRGHKVTVCTTDACDAQTRLLSPACSRTPDGVEVRTFRNLSNRLAYHLQFFLPVGLRGYLRAHAETFDVAHLHACRNVPGAVASYHLRRAGVPYVLAPNGTAPVIERRRLAKHAFDIVAGRRVVTGAARVLAVSRAEESQLREAGVADSAIRLIPNPVDLDEFIPTVPRGHFRRRFDLGAAPIVMFLGKFTPRKRVDVLARAFAGLNRLGARLVLAGNDMGAEAGLRALVRTLNIEDRTLFTGLQRGRERLEALADADVVVYPSAHEIFGLVPLESILAGTPVIVSDDSGCGEIVRAVGGGDVIPLGDVQSLTRAIDVVLENPDAKRAAVADAAMRVRRDYGADVVCAALESMYRELVTTA
jgi:glycosyltransferase involved in cell wall biosynthesis